MASTWLSVTSVLVHGKTIWRLAFLVPLTPLIEKSIWLTVSLPGFQPAGQTKRNKNQKRQFVKNCSVLFRNSWVTVFLYKSKETVLLRAFQITKCLSPVMFSYTYNVRKQAECPLNKADRSSADFLLTSSRHACPRILQSCGPKPEFVFVKTNARMRPDPGTDIFKRNVF